ncbi:MAG: PEP-CTERM sorting domain-containing protein, partial [Planctomycetes bacterium]|nr:PEP-CTERM sorting domain-containing protein [Planctomycetota bacterium]
ATVIVSVSSNEVAVGGNITVSVSSDDTVQYRKYLDMVMGTATLGAVTILPAAGDAATTADYSVAGSYYDLELVAADFSTDPVAGVHFTVVATATGVIGETFTLELLNGDTYALEDSEIVTIIPEPVTMALLGLGGLFFRRKK